MNLLERKATCTINFQHCISTVLAIQQNSIVYDITNECHCNSSLKPNVSVSATVSDIVEVAHRPSIVETNILYI